MQASSPAAAAAPGPVHANPKWSMSCWCRASPVAAARQRVPQPSLRHTACPCIAPCQNGIGTIDPEVLYRRTAAFAIFRALVFSFFSTYGVLIQPTAYPESFWREIERPWNQAVSSLGTSPCAVPCHCQTRDARRASQYRRNRGHEGREVEFETASLEELEKTTAQRR